MKFKKGVNNKWGSKNRLCKYCFQEIQLRRKREM